tara:strand:- start:276 stop:506 length:231 start_codon:yes stop_codon:yes gene_type:complete
MQSLIRERNGKEEIWYSSDYVKQQIERAYKAGLSKGIKVKIYAVQPTDNQALDDLTEVFNKRIREEYENEFGNLKI